MTRYELFRKRIAPALFLGVVALIAYDAWQRERAAAITGTVVLDFGAAAPQVRDVEAELLVGGESISTFRRTALPGAPIGDTRFPARLPDEAGELRLVIDLGAQPRHRLTRAIHVAEGATVRVELGAALAQAPR
jgi:hypothetical protein